MTVVKRAFEPDLITVRLPLILPSRQVTHDMLTSVRYAAILASIRELRGRAARGCIPSQFTGRERSPVIYCWMVICG
jgi:hypothetical protein